MFCPNGCAHCANAEETRDRRAVSPAQARKIIAQLARYGVTEVSLTAGEPFLYKDLVGAVIVPGNRLGMLFNIASSGVGLREKDLAVLLSSEHNNQLTLSLDGDVPPVNDKIRFKGSFARAVSCLDSINKYLDGKTTSLSVVVRHTVTAANHGRISRFLKLMDRYPVDAVIVSLVERAGNAGEEMLVPPGRVLAAFEAKLRAEAGAHSYRILYRNSPKTGAGMKLVPARMPCHGQNSLYIDNLGDMVPCSRLLPSGTSEKEKAQELFEKGFSRPNILKAGLERAIKSPLFENFNRYFEKSALEQKKLKGCSGCKSPSKCRICPLTVLRVKEKEKTGARLYPCKEI